MAEFPVDHACHSGAFLEAIRTWLMGSPHTGLRHDDLVPLGESRAWNLTKRNEGVQVLRADTPESERCGVRYRTGDARLVWVTSAVFARSHDAAWIGLRVACESRHPAVRLPRAKKPVLVRVLLDELGGAHDGILRVDGAPVRLSDTDIAIASKLIRGTSGCHLPIVYISAGFRNEHLLDADRLARDLSGMAHVVVEPNRPFSLRLQIGVDSANVYGGSIGVYWPQGGGRRSFFIGAEYEAPSEIAKAVFDEVRGALINRRGLPQCTWAFLQGTASRQAIAELRAADSREVQKYVDTFDQELDSKNQELAAAEKEIRRLTAEVQIHEARLAAASGTLLRAGDEQDLYPNEVLNAVYEAIDEARVRTAEGTRRRHVLDAVVRANSPGDDVASDNRRRLKEILRDSRGLDSKTKRQLEDMGFSITEDGKHYKLIFQSDERYTFSLPKTGSDWRGGLNAASEIAKRLF